MEGSSFAAIPSFQSVFAIRDLEIGFRGYQGDQYRRPNFLEFEGRGEPHVLIFLKVLVNTCLIVHPRRHPRYPDPRGLGAGDRGECFIHSIDQL